MILHQVSNVFKQYGVLAWYSWALSYGMQLNFPVVKMEWDGEFENYDCLWAAKDALNSPVQT